MLLPKTYTFRFGEGQISGFLSAVIGGLSLLAVLCFRYPAQLTFAQLRQVEELLPLRAILGVAIIVALALGVINFCIGRWRLLGGIGMATALVALVLGGASATSDGVHQWSFLPLGLDWFILDLLASAIIFIPLERLFALRRAQPILRAEWRLDLQYFALVHLLVSAVLILSTGIVTRLCTWHWAAPVQATVRSLPVIVQLPLIMLAADLAQYWMHRSMHTFPFLWRFHAVHHSSTSMDWLASSRNHMGEILMTRTGVLAPIFVLGFSPLPIQLYVIYLGLHAIFFHANVRLTFGPLRYLVVTPVFHHWHHSDDGRAANTNYAIHWPFLDKLFGTYFQPREFPVSYGIGEEKLPPGIVRQFLHPFVTPVRMLVARSTAK